MTAQKALNGQNKPVKAKSGQSNMGIRSRVRSYYRAAASLFILSFVATGGLMPTQVSAATYTATTSNAKVSLSVGEKKQVTLTFKNTGTGTWTSGKTKTALYLYGRSSLFGHPAWLKDDMPSLIKQSSVKTGQTATATFWVQAPFEPGVYRERYLLSYGENAWVKGSTAEVEYTVKGQQAVSVQATQPNTVETQAAIETSKAMGESSEWKAELVDRGGIEWQLGPQDHTVVTVAFKNTGTKTWLSTGKNYVSLYTGKDSRKSGFKDFSWKSDSQVVALKEPSVRPNEIGHFTVELRAPEVPGSYQESFQLAAEDAAWISGGTFSLPITVSMPNDYIAKGIPSGGGSNLVQPSQSGNYRGLLMISSTKDVSLLGNGRISLTYGFKNTGTATWNSLSLRLATVRQLTTTNLSSKLLSVRDESWVASNEPVRAQNVTAPGHIGFVGFTLKAPPKKGKYAARFSLYVDNQPVSEAEVDIPITVTADGYIEPDPVPVPVTVTAPSTQTTQTTTNNPPVVAQPLSGDVSSLPNEPIIRVGLFKTTDDQMVVRAVNGGFSLLQNGTTVCSFNFGDSVAINYDRNNKVYKAAGPGCNVQSTGVYVAVAPDGLTPLEMTDFYRPVSWLPGANDNKFRGKLELRYTPATDAVWVINELPIEWYLKGMAETSNSSPQEYQRALLTAARTYAMYHVQRGTKHANENYIVDATYDQVYRGYGAEIRDSNVVAAIDATRGQIVTYNGKLAITPYYSRSDGRTRSWTEVWGGGPYPWLVGVSVPWDQGKTLWGHGVGMSATGALGMAADGWTYDRMLKYFYTGIEIKQIYK